MRCRGLRNPGLLKTPSLAFSKHLLGGQAPLASTGKRFLPHQGGESDFNILAELSLRNRKRGGGGHHAL